jgi:hypothetical protein
MWTSDPPGIEELLIDHHPSQHRIRMEKLALILSTLALLTLSLPARAWLAVYQPPS